MNRRELAHNFTAAFASQGISMCLSLITSLVLPKVLGVTQFGYWQLFTFYMSYTVYAQLGVGDGIYLVNGGKRRDEMPISEISAQFALSFAIQLVCAGAIVVYALSVSDDASRCFVFLCTAAMLVLQCSTNFLSVLFQAVNEPNVYSYALIVNRISFLVILAPMLVLGVQDFRPYVIAFVAANVLMLAFMLVRGREFVFSRPCGLARAARLFIAHMKVGLFLVVATGASTFSLGVMRFLLDLTQPIEVFSVVSLSLSLVTFILSFISQVGMVLFPALRRADSGEQARVYSFMKGALSALLPGVYLLYFPLLVLLGIWLPEYTASLTMFVYLIPICVFEGQMQMVYTTYFKVLRKEQQLLCVNLLGVAIAAVGSLVGLLALGSIEFALVLLACAYIVRTIVAEALLNRLLAGRFTHADAEALALTALFIVANCLFTPSVAFAIVAVAWLALLAANRTTLVRVYRAARSNE